jgi:hypothetical protein
VSTKGSSAGWRSVSGHKEVRCQTAHKRAPRHPRKTCDGADQASRAGPRRSALRGAGVCHGALCSKFEAECGDKPSLISEVLVIKSIDEFCFYKSAIAREEGTRNTGSWRQKCLVDVRSSRWRDWNIVSAACALSDAVAASPIASPANVAARLNVGAMR